MKNTLRSIATALVAFSLVAGPVATAIAAAPVEVEVEQHDQHTVGEPGDAHDDHHGAAHHGGKTRAADEDLHWWLGLELFPKDLRQSVADAMGPSLRGESAEKLNVGHIFFGVFVLLIGLGMALAARARIRQAGLPPERWSFLAFFDVIIEMLLGLMEGMMPRERALQYLPLMTAVAIFIFLSNALGLIPGLVPPTQSLNTTMALAAFAFLYYNWQGIRAHGPVAYLKHFMGPMIWLAPIMLPIEIFSHVFRPVSLSIRLMGNMFGDHQVLFRFMAFGLPLVPLPVMALGLIVVLVQTLVFTLLFMVYISLAIEVHHHDDEHEHEHEDEHAPGIPKHLETADVAV